MAFSTSGKYWRVRTRGHSREFRQQKKLRTFLLEIATKTEEDEEMNETCLKKKETDKRVSTTTIQLKRWFFRNQRQRHQSQIQVVDSVSLFWPFPRQTATFWADHDHLREKWDGSGSHYKTSSNRTLWPQQVSWLVSWIKKNDFFFLKTYDQTAKVIYSSVKFYKIGPCKVVWMRRSRIEEREKSSTAPQKKINQVILRNRKARKYSISLLLSKIRIFFSPWARIVFVRIFIKNGKSQIKNFFVDSSQLISTETRFRRKSYFACGAGSGSDFFGFSTGFGFGSGFGISSPSSVGIK